MKGKESIRVIKRDFTKNDRGNISSNFSNLSASPRKPCMSDKDKQTLQRISEMMKQESLHFCKRLEKSIRILADVSGLSSTSPMRFDLTGSGKLEINKIKYQTNKAHLIPLREKI